MTNQTKRSLLAIALIALTLAACGSEGDGAAGLLARRAATASTSASPSTPAPSAPTATSTTVEPATTTPTSQRPAVSQPIATEPATTIATTTTAPATTTTTTPPPVTYTVSSVVDGDTVDVATSDGHAFRVRLIGIDAPESGVCEAAPATETITGLVNGKAITLTTGGDGEDTDKYGRLLRYIDVDGNDAGLALINMGYAKARYDSRDGYGRHTREDSYIAADQASPDYTCPPAPTTAPATTQPAPKPTTPRTVVATAEPADSGCDPNYSGCVPIDSDVDCAGGKGNGPSYVAGPVQVIGTDIYDLDRDHNGIGCE